MSDFNEQRVSDRASYSVLQSHFERYALYGTPIVMGVLNTTPDSFSDGGKYLQIDRAVAHADSLVLQGADIIDIGGESTRPSTFNSGEPLDEEEELRRVLPILEAIACKHPTLPISIDTYKAQTAKRALQSGAVMVNDVSAMRADPRMADEVRSAEAFVCLMHMPGLPSRLPQSPHYGDVVMEVYEHLVKRAGYAEQCGIPPSRICIDPGIGFGKSVKENLQIINQIDRFAASPWSVLVGPSRKSFLGAILGGMPPQDRLEATLAAVSICVINGAAVVRVHDVAAARRAALVAAALRRAKSDDMQG